MGEEESSDTPQAPLAARDAGKAPSARESDGWRSREQLLALVRDGVQWDALSRVELERLRHDLLLALTLERDQVTRELLPIPLTRDEFNDLDDFYRQVMARLVGE